MKQRSGNGFALPFRELDLRGQACYSQFYLQLIRRLFGS